MKKLLSISLFFLALVISCEKNTPEPSKNTSDGFTLDSIEEKSFYLKPGDNKILTPVIEDGYKYDVKTLLWEFTDKDIEGFTLTKVDDKSGKYIISVSKDVEIGTTIRLRIKGNGLSIIYTVIIEEAIFEDFGINGIVGDTLTMNLAKGMSSVTYEIDATLSGWGNIDSVYQLVYEIDSSDVIKLSDTTLTATGIGSAEVTVSVKLKEKYKDVEHLQKTIPDPIIFNVDVITKEIGKIEIYINGDLASNKTSLLPNKTHTITTKVYDIDDELININPVLNLENTTKDCKITIKNGGLKVEEGDIFTEANNNATLKAEISGIKCSVDITVDFKRIEVKKIEIYINDNLASDEMSLLPNETHTITTKVYDIDDELVDIDPVLSLEDTTENSVISIENGTITVGEGDLYTEANNNATLKAEILGKECSVNITVDFKRLDVKKIEIYIDGELASGNKITLKEDDTYAITTKAYNADGSIAPVTITTTASDISANSIISFKENNLMVKDGYELDNEANQKCTLKAAYNDVTRTISIEIEHKTYSASNISLKTDPYIYSLEDNGNIYDNKIPDTGLKFKVYVPGNIPLYKYFPVFEDDLMPRINVTTDKDKLKFGTPSCSVTEQGELFITLPKPTTLYYGKVTIKLNIKDHDNNTKSLEYVFDVLPSKATVNENSITFIDPEKILPLCFSNTKVAKISVGSSITWNIEPTSNNLEVKKDADNYVYFKLNSLSDLGTNSSAVVTATDGYGEQVKKTLTLQNKMAYYVGQTLTVNGKKGIVYKIGGVVDENIEYGTSAYCVYITGVSKKWGSKTSKIDGTYSYDGCYSSSLICKKIVTENYTQCQAMDWVYALNGANSAQKSTYYNDGKYYKWYFPARYEMNDMLTIIKGNSYINDRLKNEGGTKVELGSTYWTSTEYGELPYYISGGNKGWPQAYAASSSKEPWLADKDNTYGVRAIARVGQEE